MIFNTSSYWGGGGVGEGHLWEYEWECAIEATQNSDPAVYGSVNIRSDNPVTPVAGLQDIACKREVHFHCYPTK